LILILRALYVNYEKTKLALRPHKGIITQPYHCWPSLTDSEWIQAEIGMKDIILEDYGKRMNITINSLTQAEIRDVILGMDIQAPSRERQRLAMMEKHGQRLQHMQQQQQQQQAADASHLTAVTTMTTDKDGNEIAVTTVSQYEQEVFNSKTDWRVRAISATNLHLRAKNLFVSSEDIGEGTYTYILPKNLLKHFISIADLRTQVCGLLYGYSPEDNAAVKEIHCIVMIPQWGTHQNVNVPKMIPEHEILKDMEPLGWIHTQPNELTQLAFQDVLLHSKLMANNKSWDGDKTIILPVSFTPGSCSLTAFKLTPKGYEWGRDTYKKNVTPQGYQTDFYQRVSLLLTPKYLGFFMVPDEESWNYNFQGIKHSENMKFGVTLGIPKPYYDEAHRSMHFMKFTTMEDKADLDEKQEDFFL